MKGGKLRTEEHVKNHYLVEKELANKLKRASRQERVGLYTEVYEELCERVPDHPMLTRKADPDSRKKDVSRQIQRIQKYLQPDTTFLEIGAGDCALSFAVCPIVRRVYGLDVSPTIASTVEQPENFELIISDGTNIPVTGVDFAYSHQLMEHIHPEDAIEQLRNIYLALKPGGAYCCITPSALNGPHDVSRGFDRVATGFHLKEYTLRELDSCFRSVGFGRTTCIPHRRGHHLNIGLAKTVERIIEALPYPVRTWIMSLPILRGSLVIVGWK